MPTAIPQPEIDAFIDIVKFKSAYEAERLPSILVNYEDIPTAIYRQLDEFSTNAPYLAACMDVFTDADLQAAGIYNEKSAITPASPVLIIASTDVDIQVATDTNSLYILGASQVNEITFVAGKALNTLYVGAGAEVGLIDVTAASSFIYRLYADFKKNVGAIVKRVLINSNILFTYIAPGAIYGGVGYDNTAACANPISTLAFTNITGDSIQLGWVAPASPYISIDISFKRSDSAIWAPATTLNGDFVGNTGFIFRKLDGDTNYDFSITVTCPNGGISVAVTGSEKTECC